MLSLIGGLYNSVASVFLTIVTILTSVGLISSITKNVFYYSKDLDKKELPITRCARNYLEDNAPLTLKEKENLIKEILHERQSTRQAKKKTQVLSLCTRLSSFVPCPCFRAKERKIMSQLWRKAEKAFDLEFIVKQAKISNSLNRAFLSQGQKLLIKFQMENFVGQEDLSDSSDNLQDVYRQKVENSELLLSSIFTELMGKEELSYLDVQLL